MPHLQCLGQHQVCPWRVQLQPLLEQWWTVSPFNWIPLFLSSEMPVKSGCLSSSGLLDTAHMHTNVLVNGSKMHWLFQPILNSLVFPSHFPDFFAAKTLNMMAFSNSDTLTWVLRNSQSFGHLGCSVLLLWVSGLKGAHGPTVLAKASSWLASNCEFTSCWPTEGPAAPWWSWTVAASATYLCNLLLWLPPWLGNHHLHII